MCRALVYYITSGRSLVTVSLHRQQPSLQGEKAVKSTTLTDTLVKKSAMQDHRLLYGFTPPLLLTCLEYGEFQVS